ncbi:IS3 family transposase [Streptomyces sp. JNUCC 63]
MVAEVLGDCPTESAALKAVAQKLGIGSTETLRNLGAAGPDRLRDPSGGEYGGISSAEGVEEGESRAAAGERDLEGGGVFPRGRDRPATSTLVAFIDEHQGRFGGVDPICRVPTEHDCKIAPSTYYAHRKRLGAPSARTVRDAELKEPIQEVYTTNFRVYGARKIWRELNRQGHAVARCTVERLMRELGIAGAVRGKRVITTLPGGQTERAPDLVDRDFVAGAPNRCWVADFTHVKTWACVVYVAFVVDTFSRRIVGWSAATVKETVFVLDALEMAIWQRDRDQHPVQPGESIHHSDAGSQGGFNRSSQHLDFGGVQDRYGGLEQEDRRCARGTSAAVAC